jgi:hypothetical protein
MSEEEKTSLLNGNEDKKTFYFLNKGEEQVRIICLFVCHFLFTICFVRKLMDKHHTIMNTIISFPQVIKEKTVIRVG